MMSDLTAQAVAQMQSDLEISERNNETLRTQLGLITAERDRLRLEASSLRQERDDALVVSTQVRTILEHTSLGLVQGINKLNDQQEQQRIARRKRQEQAFETEFGETKPQFLRRPAPITRDNDEDAYQGLEPEPQRPYIRQAPEGRPVPDPRAFRRAPIERTPVALRTDAMPPLRESDVRAPRRETRPMPSTLPPASDDHPYANDPRMPRVSPQDPGPHDETQTQRDQRNLSELARKIGMPDDGEDFQVRHSDMS